MFTMCLVTAITAAACDDGGASRDAGPSDANDDMQSDAGTTTDAMIDETAPETSFVSTPDDPTNDGSATFEFEADEPATFRCRVDAEAFADCSSPHTMSVSDGDHTFEVFAIDETGNEDESPASYDWLVDTTAPDTTITAAPPVADNSVNVTFEFESNELGSTFECSTDGAPYTTCSSPTTVNGLADGAHTFSVRATDGVGNTDDTPAQHAWDIDSSTPDTQIDSGPTGPTPSTSATFTFSSADATMFECSLDGGAFGSCTSPRAYPSVSEAAHTFAVRAIDGVGNTDPTPAQRSWTADVTAPNTVIDSGPVGSVSSTSASFSFSSNEGGAVFECNLDGAGYGPCSSPLALSSLSETSHNLAVRAIDPATNVDPTPATRAWTVDLTGPVVTINSTPSDPTNTTSATFAFTSEPGASFECSLDSTTTYSACSSPRTYMNLTEGSHTFRVRATDVANNTGNPASDTWTVDVTVPVVTITSEPADPTNSTSASFSFTSEPGASFECSLNSTTTYAACTSPRTYSSLTAGTRTFRVRAIDTAGNTGAPDSSVWTVDLTAPSVTITSGPADPTNATSASFSFTSEAGASFECSLNSTTTYSACTSPHVYNSLTAGTRTFRVRATDTAGNTGAPASDVWTIDLTPPIVTITSEPNDPTNATSASFSFTSEAGVSFECSLNSTTTYSACTSPRTYSSLTAGTRTFRVRATDTAGNTGSPAASTWTVDLTAPTVTITSGPNNPTNSQGAVFAFTSEAGASFECSLDSTTSYSACSSGQTYAGVSAGAHTFRVRAIDLAGNTSTAAAYPWTIDLTPPQITGFTGPSGTVASTSGTFGWTCSEASCTFQCRLDNEIFAACTSPVTRAGLGQGSHTFYVHATDPAGNTGPATSRTWTVDTVPPNTNITSGPANPYPVNYATFTFSSTGGGVSYQCRVDNGTWSACTSAHTRTGLSFASHTFQVRASDAVGNTDASPASWSWTAARGLVLYYPFNENTRNYSALGAVFDGEIAGTIDYRGSYFGKAAVFSGDGSFVNIANTIEPLSSDYQYTVSLWFQDPNPTFNQASSLIDFLGGAGGCRLHHEVQDPNLTLCCAGDDGLDACTTFDMTGGWHHLALMYAGTGHGPGNGAQVDVYVDGYYWTSLANSPLADIFSDKQQSDLQVGRGSAFWVDELRVYNRTYSQAELCRDVIGGRWDGQSCKLPVPGLHVPFDGSPATASTWSPDYTSGQLDYVDDAVCEQGAQFLSDATSYATYFFRSDIQYASEHVFGAWFRDGPNPPVNGGRLMDNYCPPNSNCAGASNGGGIVAYYLGGNLNVCFQGSSSLQCASVPYAPNEWNHIGLNHRGGYDNAGNLEGADLEIYLNGKIYMVVANSDLYPIFQNPNYDFFVGTSSHWEVDEVRGYDLAMSEQWMCTAVAGGVYDNGGCELNAVP